MTARGRLIAFGVLFAGCVLTIAVVIAGALRAQDETGQVSEAARSALAGAEQARRPVLLYRSLASGRPERAGQLAVAPLEPAPGAATLEPLRCDRSYYAAGSGICLDRGSGFAAGYRARVFDARFHVRASVAVEGIPSRARVSPDGRYGSVTLFVAGHSYVQAGGFSTQTTLIDLRRGAKLADLEEFAVMHGRRRVTAVDANFWGVTFARDSDRFYATMATGGRTYLIAGSVARRTARVLRENVECPSLSPDGTRIAYKKRTASDDVPWRLHVLELATLRDTALAETRSVDDQAEWLDDDSVLYGADGAVWEVPADGSGAPRRLVERADSPAVLRF
jgi:hypothetical protein